MNKKWKFLSLGSSFITISPLFFAISCSNNSSNEKYSIHKALISNHIKISVDSDETNKVKITDLENSKFIFEVNDTGSNSEPEKNYYNELKKILKETEIKLVGFYIPILNKDNESYLIFEVENQIAQISVSNIYHNDQKIQLENLSADEIVATIDEKLNEKDSFITNLKAKLDNILVKEYKEYIENNQSNEMNSDFFSYWTKEKLTRVQIEIKDFLVKNYPFYFNGTLYDNTFISKISLKEAREKISVDFSVFTSAINDTPQSAYKIPTITLYL